MIEGLKILNQVEHGTPCPLVVKIFLTMAIIACLVGLFYMIRNFVFDSDLILLEILAIILIIVLMITCVWLFYISVTTRETIVQATIDDTASFIKINEMYTFVKQEGEIYTLKLKPAQ